MICRLRAHGVISGEAQGAGLFTDPWDSCRVALVGWKCMDLPTRITGRPPPRLTTGWHPIDGEVHYAYWHGRGWADTTQPQQATPARTTHPIGVLLPVIGVLLPRWTPPRTPGFTHDRDCIEIHDKPLVSRH